MWLTGENLYPVQNQRNLAKKQQERCFERDKAQITQLAANSPKHQF